MESIQPQMETSNARQSGGASPLVSVVMPAFKAAYLEATLETILSQSFRDFELIIVDDASPDDLRSIVERHPDPRLRYQRNSTNIGSRSLVENWNLCLSLARGRYFVLASDDDLYHPDYLTSILALAERHPNCGVFHSRVSIIDGQGREIGRTHSCPEWESWDDFLWHRLRLVRTHYVPEFMFRTEALRVSGGFVDFPFAWNSDTATAVRVGMDGGICCVPELLVQWRSSGANISTSDRYSRDKFRAFLLFPPWIEQMLGLCSSPMEHLIRLEIPRYARMRAKNHIRTLPASDLLALLNPSRAKSSWLRPADIVTEFIRRTVRGIVSTSTSTKA